MLLRRPQDTLSGSVWLPRFIDKARHHLAGTLEAGYQGAFCNPLGIDGVFLAHFGLKPDDILEVIRRETTDDAVAAWFRSSPGVTPEKIAAWNELAPNIGRPGYPGDRTFRWTMKYVYGGCSDPRVTSGFLAIAWDEGFLADMCPEENDASPAPS